MVLYNCPTLGNGCSSCLAQNINTGFNCSWCDSNMCSERSVCTNNIVTMNGDCPNPVITNFNPTSGPPQGRTQLPYMVVIWVPSPQRSSLLPLAVGHVPLTQICMYLGRGQYVVLLLMTVIL